MNEQLKFKLDKLPKLPGCYLYKNQNEVIIYVGKAKNLYNRVHQYFNNDAHDLKTSKLIADIFDLEIITVKNENESLLLENNLIKKYQPKYNILLKDGAGYPYIVVTNEKYPRLIYTRDNRRFKGKYYGPFANVKSNRFEVYNLLLQLFPLRKCNVVPQSKCIYYDMGLCLGPCINQIDPKKYLKITAEIDNFFKGNISNIKKNLFDLQQTAAEKLKFEDALKYKNLIAGVEEIVKNQSIILDDKQNIDVIGFYVKDSYVTIVIFSYIDGKLLIKFAQIFDFYGPLYDTISSFIMQYYEGNQTQVRKVFIRLEPDLISLLSKELEITFYHPVTGKYQKIVELAVNNAKDYFEANFLQYKKELERTVLAFEQFKNFVQLDNLSLINVFDMSNLFGDDKVGAMIALENGSFNKKLYRKFLIKNLKANSDGEYMYEVIRRQYYKQLVQHQQLPNLIIVDGGIIQINAAVKALESLKLNLIIPVIGLQKNSKHETDAIIIKNQIFKLDHQTPLYFYLSNIQEEVHRFTINFFRKTKLNSTFKNILSTVEGLGEKRIATLLTHYEDITKLRQASVEELIQYVPKETAVKIKTVVG